MAIAYSAFIGVHTRSILHYMYDWNNHHQSRMLQQHIHVIMIDEDGKTLLPPYMEEE